MILPNVRERLILRIRDLIDLEAPIMFITCSKVKGGNGTRYCYKVINGKEDLTFDVALLFGYHMGAYGFISNESDAAICGALLKAVSLEGDNFIERLFFR